MGSEPVTGVRRRLHMDKVLRISDVAQMAGWEYQRMRKHLHKLDHELNGTLLAKHRGPDGRCYYTITLGKLQQIQSPWFRDADTLAERVEDLEMRQAELVEHIERQARKLGDISKRLVILEVRAA